MKYVNARVSMGIFLLISLTGCDVQQFSTTSLDKKTEKTFSTEPPAWRVDKIGAAQLKDNTGLPSLAVEQTQLDEVVGLEIEAEAGVPHVGTNPISVKEGAFIETQEFNARSGIWHYARRTGLADGGVKAQIWFSDPSIREVVVNYYKNNEWKASKVYKAEELKKGIVGFPVEEYYQAKVQGLGKTEPTSSSVSAEGEPPCGSWWNVRSWYGSSWDCALDSAASLAYQGTASELRESSYQQGAKKFDFDLVSFDPIHLDREKVGLPLMQKARLLMKGVPKFEVQNIQQLPN